MRILIALFLLISSASSLRAITAQEIDMAVKKALTPPDASEFFLNPYLSVRVKISYEQQGSNEAHAVRCSALIYTPETLLLLDEACANFAREKSALWQEGDFFTLLADFGHFGQYNSGDFAGIGFFYLAQELTPEKFNYTGKYASFWAPVHSPRLLKKLQARQYPKLPDEKMLARIFKRLAKPDYLQYVNPFTYVM